MPSSDEQFEQVWAEVHSMWKKGDKDDAKYFWLLGQKMAYEKSTGGYQQARQQVEEAKDALR